jgi:hypothetical protein
MDANTREYQIGGNRRLSGKPVLGRNKTGQSKNPLAKPGI